MTGVVSNETNTYVRMYIEEFILVDLDTLLYKVEVENIGKYTGFYTLATKDWEMWELLLGANWQVRVNRITIAWETVTSEN